MEITDCFNLSTDAISTKLHFIHLGRKGRLHHSTAPRCCSAFKTRNTEHRIRKRYQLCDQSTSHTADSSGQLHPHPTLFIIIPWPGCSRFCGVPATENQLCSLSQKQSEKKMRSVHMLAHTQHVLHKDQRVNYLQLHCNLVWELYYKSLQCRVRTGKKTIGVSLSS